MVAPAVAESSRAFSDAAGLPSDARPAIDGDIIRDVAGFKVHNIGGVDYLSVSTVFRVLRFGDLSHIPPHVLEPAAERGKNVGALIAEIVEADPTRGRHFGKILAKLGDDVIPVALRPYLDAAAKFIDAHEYSIVKTEGLVLDEALRVFGYYDAYGFDGDGALCSEWKTGASIYLANRWQVTLYTPPGERGLLVQLGKDGRYHETPCCTDDDRRQLAAAAELAHLYIAERGPKRKR